jgi:hypothetical protein
MHQHCELANTPPFLEKKITTDFSNKMLVSCQSVLNSMKAVDIENELQLFIKQKSASHDVKVAPLPIYYHFPSFEASLFQEPFNPMDYTKPPNPVNPKPDSLQSKLDIKVAELVETILLGGETATKASDTLTGVLATSEGRTAFATALSHHRNNGFNNKVGCGLELKRPAFEALAAIIHRFLDQAYQTMHTAPTQIVMIMSQTFYLEQERGEEHVEKRVYLQHVAKKHPIWRSPRFWEEAFFVAFAKELKNHKQSQASRWHTDQEQAEATDRQKKILFGKLSAYAHNMLGFGMDTGSTLKFVQKMCNINELGQNETKAIVGIVHAYSASPTLPVASPTGLPPAPPKPEASFVAVPPGTPPMPSYLAPRLSESMLGSMNPAADDRGDEKCTEEAAEVTNINPGSSGEDEVWTNVSRHDLPGE